MITTKPCTKCREVKPRIDFYLQGGYPAGMCKSCYNGYQKYRRMEIRRIAKELRAG